MYWAALFSDGNTFCQIMVKATELETLLCCGRLESLSMQETPHRLLSDTFRGKPQDVVLYGVCQNLVLPLLCRKDRREKKWELIR